MAKIELAPEENDDQKQPSSSNNNEESISHANSSPPPPLASPPPESIPPPQTQPLTTASSPTISSNQTPPQPCHQRPQYDEYKNNDDDLDSHPIVEFPPRSLRDIHATQTQPQPQPNNQLVLYAQLPPSESQQEHHVRVQEITSNGITGESTNTYAPNANRVVQQTVADTKINGSVANNSINQENQLACYDNAGETARSQNSSAAGSRRQSSINRPQVVLVPAVGNPWSSGLFDCCSHPTNAILTTVAPCVTFGQIAEIVDNGSTGCVTGAALYCCLSLVVCHWKIGVRYRKRVRNAFQLAETPLTDRLSHVLFPLCALCQEFRELKNQGYDPFL
ncbi:PLAC8 motif-containing protein, partial [Dillenia turbinata]